MTVNGSVYDTNGEPLIGVSVSVKGTTAGAVTDLDGNFKVDAKQGSTILFKYIGYKEKEVKVGSVPALGRIVLEDSSSELDEVVVVGYGTQRKRDIAGSITSVDAKMIEQRNPVNVQDALQGSVAGMLVTQVSGEPGTEASVTIRGLSTFESGTSPLYVVDGVIMSDISAINPSDITRIEVLKDAASASIYGARGANGVVIISTKSGAEGKPRITARYLQSYSSIANTLPQLNREEREIFDNTVVSAGQKNQFQWFKSSNDTVNLQARTSNNYQEIISQIAVRNDASVSMQTGTDKLNVYASLGLLDETGIILTSWNKRYTGRAKVVYNVYPNVKFTTNVTGGFQNRNAISEGNTFYQAIRRPTQSILYFPDGTLVNRYESNPSGKRNPLIELFEYKNETATYSGQLYQGVEIKFAKYFTLNGSASASLSYADNVVYQGPGTAAGSLDAVKNGDDKGSRKITFRTDYLGETYLLYHRLFNKVHNVEVMAGLSAQKKTGLNPLDVSMANFLIKGEDMQVPQMLRNPLTIKLTGEPETYASQFGRVSYDYKGRYIFRSSIRRDGSSKFGPGNQWGIFPSISGAWRLSDEFFMDWAKPILTDAKFRLSYGSSGNDGIPNFAYRTAFKGSSADGYAGIAAGVYPDTRLGNLDLKWETTTQTNYGLDLTLLDGKVSFTADYYIKATSDLLNREPIPSELGYTERFINWGGVENKGIELSVTAYPVDNKDWTWSTTVMWTKNKQKITELPTEPYAYSPTGSYATWWVEEGMPTGQFYGYKSHGVYAYDASNAYTPDYKTRLTPVFERDPYGNVVITKSGGPQVIAYKYPDGRDYGWNPEGTGNPINKMIKGGGSAFTGGDVIWDDYNHDGVIDFADKQVLANAQPQWFGSWNNTLRWKEFTLNVNIYTSWGGTVYNYLLFQMSSYGDNTSNSDPRAVVQGWRYQGQQTEWYAPGGKQARTTENERTLNSCYLEDATFIRLQSLRLSYQLNANIAKMLKLQNVQVYGYGNNLATWTNYRGYDPEISTGGVLNPGEDNNKYPKKRELGFGVNLTF
ncbi:hypothetical protein FACS1894176_03840 [Bacteroidia bacterium]|nr:hypothetical protein FACS1894176_03840 [Bacteroidia bacterium]